MEPGVIELIGERIIPAASDMAVAER